MTLGTDKPEAERDDLDISFDYIGPGYGQVSPGCLEASALLARTEGIFLDPISSGQAMAGRLETICRTRIGGWSKVSLFGGVDPCALFLGDRAFHVVGQQLHTETGITGLQCTYLDAIGYIGLGGKLWQRVE